MNRTDFSAKITFTEFQELHPFGVFLLFLKAEHANGQVDGLGDLLGLTWDQESQSGLFWQARSDAKGLLSPSGAA
jgi:hypothetical protein